MRYARAACSLLLANVLWLPGSDLSAGTSGGAGSTFGADSGSSSSPGGGVNEPRAAEIRDRSLDFDDSGLQVGDTIPDFMLGSLDGERVPLSALWLGRPTVLVTCSITCPVSRKRMEHVERLERHFGDEIHVVLLYTIEAHPKGSGSPYSIDRVEWVGRGNHRQNIFRPQPQSLEHRKAHAHEFIDRMGTDLSLFLDGMDNKIWEALGGGPNMGFLIGTDGRIEVKHGWFEGGSMYRSVESFLDRTKPGWRRADDPATSPDPDLEKEIEVESAANSGETTSESNGVPRQ